MSCRVMRSDGLHLEDIHMTFCQLVDIDIDTDKNKTEEHSNMETGITLSENQHYSQ